MRSTDVELGPAYKGTFEIEIHEAPEEELAGLRPLKAIAGYSRRVDATPVGGRAWIEATHDPRGRGPGSGSNRS